MDSKILFRCGLVWVVLLLFAVDGSSLIRAADNQLPAQHDLADQTADDDEATQSQELVSDPIPYPVLKKPPTWFVEDQEYSDVSGILDVKTERNCIDLKQAENVLWRVGVQKIAPILDHWYGAGASRKIDLDARYVRDRLIHDNLVAFQEVQKEGPIVDGVENCYIGYARLELNQEFREFAKECLQESRTRQRIMGAGILGGTVLSMLVVALGYLKLEAATRGFYSRRLQMLAIIAAGAIAVAAILCLQST